MEINQQAIDIITCAIGVIEANGHYTSRRDAAVSCTLSTVDLVKDKMEKTEVFRMDQHLEAAHVIGDWIRREYSDSEVSGYITNAYDALFSSEGIGTREVGTLISLPSAFTKAMERFNEYKFGHTINESFMGAVADVITTDLNSVSTRVMRNKFGKFTVVTGQAPNNNILFWYVPKLSEIDGDQLHLTAQINAHKIIDGHHQTQLSNVKLLD